MLRRTRTRTRTFTLILAFTFASTLAFSLTACAPQLKGTGSEVAAQVRTAMAALPDRTDSQWPTCRELTDAKDGFVGAANNLAPTRGDFVYILGSRHKFDSQRAVEIQIRPWDERPGVARQIYINTWHWGGIPPLIPKPDLAANADVRREIELLAIGDGG